jgi:hypothetical protein
VSPITPATAAPQWAPWTSASVRVGAAQAGGEVAGVERVAGPHRVDIRHRLRGHVRAIARRDRGHRRRPALV